MSKENEDFEMRVAKSLRELNLPKKHIDFLRAYLSNVSELSYVDRIILFGSCAKGTANDRSDIDLFVVTKTGLDDDSEEMYRLFYQSTENIPLSDYVCCDILTASASDFELKATPLIRIVLREGVVLNGLLR